MADITRRSITVGHLRMHIAEAGSGPLVILLHGFPESSYSWRHQLTALADAGFHAVAPDQRGYGRTGGPADVSAYTILHLVGDVVGLVTSLGDGPAAVVGQDWGAVVAWHTALLRPDLVRGVVGLSVPYLERTTRPPVELMRETFGEGYYVVYFQEQGAPEAELERDIPATFRRFLVPSSGDAAAPPPVVPSGGGFLARRPEPAVLPN
ncbi:MULTISPECIES: alpha/beta fold hydrolase [unclassified Parafrankia]|uniref:alpha/beta fold hydrolase n=1 Tax=unclassified Parafrankia TaxID=2994368 RepID=UPI000DA44E48